MRPHGGVSLSQDLSKLSAITAAALFGTTIAPKPTPFSWNERNRWPLDQKDSVFLASAFLQLGRAMFGEEWSDDAPGAQTAWPVPPRALFDSITDPSSEMGKTLAPYMPSFKTPEEKEAEAARLRREANGHRYSASLAASDAAFVATMTGHAEEYERRAEALEREAQADRESAQRTRLEGDAKYEDTKAKISAANAAAAVNKVRCDAVQRRIIQALQNGDLKPV